MQSPWYLYNVPFNKKKSIIGQKQKWFLAIAATEPKVILSSDEFKEWQWQTPTWILDHIIDWKKSIYCYAMKKLNLI